jgi:hypothetical protein
MPTTCASRNTLHLGARQAMSSPAVGNVLILELGSPSSSLGLSGRHSRCGRAAKDGPTMRARNPAVKNKTTVETTAKSRCSSSDKLARMFCTDRNARHFISARWRASGGGVSVEARDLHGRLCRRPDRDRAGIRQTAGSSPCAARQVCQTVTAKAIKSILAGTTPNS